MAGGEKNKQYLQIILKLLGAGAFDSSNMLYKSLLQWEKVARRYNYVLYCINFVAETDEVVSVGVVFLKDDLISRAASYLFMT